MPNARLAAALAYHPTTARCRDCRQRYPYEQMTANNARCRRCWAALCAQYRARRRAQ